MKLLLVLSSAAFAVLVLAACDKRPAASPPLEEPADGQPSVIAQATPAPAPPAPTTPAPATPAPISHLAPEGVFFLLAQTSIETDAGIVGITPGTRLLRQSDGTYLAGEHRLTLRDDQVTNDLRVAQRLAGVDQAAQAALRQRAQKAAASKPASPVPQRAAQQRSPAESSEALPQPESPPQYVPGVNTQSTRLQSSTSLGAAHTRTQNGWIWQKSPDGQWWVPVKRPDGKNLVPPPHVRVR